MFVVKHVILLDKKTLSGGTIEEVAALVKEKWRLFKLWKEPKKCKKGCRCGKPVGESCVGFGLGERLEMRVVAWT